MINVHSDGAILMAGEKKRRRSKKMERIVATATELFVKHGIKRITVEEICREAGASKMTFYKYFDNKIDLMRHIWQNWFDEGYARLDEIDAMEIPFKEKMELLIDWKMNLLKRMSPDFLEEVLHAAPELTDFLMEMRQKNLSLFMEFVAKAQARGDMRKINPAFFMAAMNKMVDMITDGDLEKLYPDRLDLIREVHDFLFFGILPAPGEGTQS
jgi:AcrR family transcriptional regulator